MAMDVDVQYFSHLNGLVLGDNWGDLIRLLDKVLVTGVNFTQITAANIDAQGDVHITLFAAHNAMLFQVVELSGFTPNSLNQKYRIKGVPGTTKLILKPKDAITVTSISVIGNGKLAPLGYDIVFRDTNDIKRVYRAKNPTDQHPFIRVDESLTSPNGSSGVYSSTYAKFAMVGLLERMDHIDDYQNPNVLQLPFDPTKPAKNWKITGKGTSVVRGWSCWYWGKYGDTIGETWGDVSTSPFTAKAFTLTGGRDAFYFQVQVLNQTSTKLVYGAGLFKSALPIEAVEPWFLMSTLRDSNASTQYGLTNVVGGTPMLYSEQQSRFLVTRYNETTPIAPNAWALPILPDYTAGATNIFGSNVVAALEIPFKDSDNYLRGVMPHLHYNGKHYGDILSTPVLNQNSMYVADGSYQTGVEYCSVIYYLGELE